MAFEAADCLAPKEFSAFGGIAFTPGQFGNRRQRFGIAGLRQGKQFCGLGLKIIPRNISEFQSGGEFQVFGHLTLLGQAEQCGGAFVAAGERAERGLAYRHISKGISEHGREEADDFLIAGIAQAVGYGNGVGAREGIFQQRKTLMGEEQAHRLSAG